MKKTILIVSAFCVIAVLFWLSLMFTEPEEVKVDKITISYENSSNKKEFKRIPVKVTLTKYQLEKMLDIVDEEYGYGGPAAPQDSFTFTSVARGREGEYIISSTHLSRK